MKKSPQENLSGLLKTSEQVQGFDYFPFNNNPTNNKCYFLLFGKNMTTGSKSAKLPFATITKIISDAV